MAISLVATLLILVAPPLVLGTRLPTQPGVRGFLMYFLFIGTGYILIEVGLIQKFVLFLGHPTYALTVVIFSMLVSSGIGSFASYAAAGRGPGAADQGARAGGADDGAAGHRGVVAALLAGVAAVGFEGAADGGADRARWASSWACRSPPG